MRPKLLTWSQLHSGRDNSPRTNAYSESSTLVNAGGLRFSNWR
jgi:hypothetical protein